MDFPTTSGGLTVLNSDDDHFFTHVDLAYYPINDLRLYGGYRYVDDTSLGAAGAEYLLRDYGSPISLFVKSDFGHEAFNRITGGLKFYFGSNSQKSLIVRHRTEDPENYTPKFPALTTQAVPGRETQSGLQQCTVDMTDRVTSPLNGECICPAGTGQAGSQPAEIVGGFSCA